MVAVIFDPRKQKAGHPHTGHVVTPCRIGQC